MMTDGLPASTAMLLHRYFEPADFLGVQMAPASQPQLCSSALSTGFMLLQQQDAACGVHGNQVLQPCTLPPPMSRRKGHAEQLPQAGQTLQWPLLQPDFCSFSGDGSLPLYHSTAIPAAPPLQLPPSRCSSQLCGSFQRRSSSQPGSYVAGTSQPGCHPLDLDSQGFVQVRQRSMPAAAHLPADLRQDPGFEQRRRQHSLPATWLPPPGTQCHEERNNAAMGLPQRLSVRPDTDGMTRCGAGNMQPRRPVATCWQQESAPLAQHQQQQLQQQQQQWCQQQWQQKQQDQQLCRQQQLLHYQPRSVCSSEQCTPSTVTAPELCLPPPLSQPRRTAARCSTITSGFPSGEPACEPRRLDSKFLSQGVSLGNEGCKRAAAVDMPPDSAPALRSSLTSTPQPEQPPLAASRPSGPALRCRRRTTARHTSSFAVDPAAPPPPSRQSAAAQAQGGQSEAGEQRRGRKAGRHAHITVAMLSDGGYLDLPIQDAAKKLNLGLSVLKRVCRDIGLVRWPYRKRNSLANVISKTQRFLAGDQKAGVLASLNSQLSQLTGEGEDLAACTKSYRQCIFKLNHKMNKLSGQQGEGRTRCRPMAISNSAAERLTQATGAKFSKVPSRRSCDPEAPPTPPSGANSGL